MNDKICQAVYSKLNVHKSTTSRHVSNLSIYLSKYLIIYLSIYVPIYLCIYLKSTIIRHLRK